MVAPVQRRFERALARDSGPGIAGQEPEPVLQPLFDLGRRQHRDAGSGQFDRQGNAVEALADPRNRFGARWIYTKGHVQGTGPVDEETDRFGVHDRGRGLIGFRNGERRDPVDDFAGDRQRLPARGDDAEAG